MVAIDTYGAALCQAIAVSLHWFACSWALLASFSSFWSNQRTDALEEQVIN